jgi:chitodextrinase
MLSTAATVTGLTPGASYLFQVRAVDANGLEIPITASTVPAEAAGILVPGGLAVTATTATSVSLSWTPSAGAIAYHVIQSLSPVGPFSLAMVATSSSATIVGLAPNTTYYFQVRAVDVFGNPGPPSNTASATTTAAASTAPTGLTVASTTPTSVTLSWAASAGAASYQVGQSLNAAGPFVFSIGITVTTAAVTGLTPNTTYFFQVRAVDAAGNVSPASSTVSATTGVSTLAAPTGLTVTGTTSTSVSASWTASAGAASYQVLIGLNAAGPFVAAGTTPTPSTTISGLTANTTYFIQVKAVDAAGNVSAASNTVAALTLP